jgi:hypothetical protein
MVAILDANRSCQGQELEQLRASVRQPSAPSPPKTESPPRSERPRRESRQQGWFDGNDEDCDDDDDGLSGLVVWGALAVKIGVAELCRIDAIAG